MPTLDELRAKAVAHQNHIDRNTKWFDVKTLAERWTCRPSTVRAIPKADLPYMNIGTGLVRERRRYHPDDVAAYEARRLRKAS